MIRTFARTLGLLVIIGYYLISPMRRNIFSLPGWRSSRRVIQQSQVALVSSSVR
jgi:hypothetical protein